MAAMKVAVLGAGAWGTALAINAGAHHAVTLWARDAEQAKHMQQVRVNTRYLPDDQMGPIVGIACPQIVYPYLRGNVADVIQRAGFPPVHLAEINFQAMYEQQQAQAQ